MARPQRVHPRRRACVPHLLHQRPRRRGDGHHLELPRHDGARTSGDLGGFAGGLPPEPAVQVVELARQLRRRRRAGPEVDRGVGRRRGRVSETQGLVREARHPLTRRRIDRGAARLNYCGVEAMDNSYRLLDLTVYGRQETWEDSPDGWPQRWKGKDRIRTDGHPTAQWPRLKAGYSDDLVPGRR